MSKRVAVTYTDPGKYGVDIITHHDDGGDPEFEWHVLDAPLNEETFIAWLADHGHTAVGEITIEDDIAGEGAGLGVDLA